MPPADAKTSTERCAAVDQDGIAPAEADGQVRKDQMAGTQNRQGRDVFRADGKPDLVGIVWPSIALQPGNIQGRVRKPNVDPIRIRIFGVEEDARTHVNPWKRELSPSLRRVKDRFELLVGDFPRAAILVERIDIEDLV